MGAAGVFWGITAGFIGMEAILFLTVIFTSRKGETGLKQILCGTTVICLWMMWAIIYIAQLHPLVRPQLQGG